MDLCGGMDLHGDNVYCTLMDREYRPVFERRLPNDLAVVLEALEPCRERVAGLVVESTYNWYWLVDGLQAQKYPTRLANPARGSAPAVPGFAPSSPILAGNLFLAAES